MPDPKEPVDLSSLQLTPDWVNDLDSGSSKTSYEKFEGADTDTRDSRPRGKGGRGGGGGQGRGGGFGGGGGNRGRGDFGGGGRGQGQGQNRGGQGDRRGGGNRDRDRRGGGGRGGDRRDQRGGDRRGGRDRGRDREFVKLEGITTEVRPTRESVKALVSRIKMSGRAFALFDLAKVVLGGRDRYEIEFKRDTSNEKSSKIFRCSSDGSLWLNREEALRHFLAGPGINDFYGVVETEIDPPKGEFKSIAVCGMSGTLLGPPNHHSYQTAVVRLHRKRFANMSLDRFKSRIKVEASEELVEKWKQEQSRVTRYIFPKPPEEVKKSEEAVPEAKPEEKPATEAETDISAAPEGVEGEAPAAEAPAEPSNEEAAAEPAPEASKEAPAEEAARSEPAAPVESEEKSEPEPQTADAEVVAEAEVDPNRIELESFEALERHLIANLADKVVVLAKKKCSVPANISGNKVAQPLMNLLRREVDQLNRSPFPLVKSMCSELERNGLKIFKRQGKKLFVSKARPRPIDPGVALSDSVKHIVDAVQAQPGIKVSEMVTSLAPRRKDVEAPKEGEFTPAERQVLTDLHWLVDEGFIIEYASSGLFLGGNPKKPKAPKPEGKKGDGKKGDRKAPKGDGTKSEKKQPAEEAAKVEAKIESKPEGAPKAEEESSVKAEPVAETQTDSKVQADSEPKQPEAEAKEVPSDSVPEAVKVDESAVAEVEVETAADPSVDEATQEGSKTQEA